MWDEDSSSGGMCVMADSKSCSPILGDLSPWELLPSLWYQLELLSSCYDPAALVFCLYWPWSSFLVLINVFIWSWNSLSCMSAPASLVLLPCERFLIITAHFCEDTLLVCPARHNPQSLGSWRAARQYFAAVLWKSHWLRPQWCWTQT